MKRLGTLFVISAPSGAGKTTLLRELMSRRDDLKFSVSYTTRKPRPGEVDGRDYSFVDEPAFRAMIGRCEFVEWAQVHTSLYGTSKARLKDMLLGGQNVVLDIDVNGARQIRAHFPEAVFVFILPPSPGALSERLRGRGSNTEEDMRIRLGRAAEEISEYSAYDYVIINDSIEQALRELDAVVTASGLRTATVEPRWIEKHFLLKEDA